MKKIKILVTGSNGQLGQALQVLSGEYKNLIFYFTDSESLDITDNEKVATFFNENKIAYCINCAAYTKVDQAEEDRASASAINVLGVDNLVQYCKKYAVKLIHISTDYVFDGNSIKPYKESDKPNPLNHYGMTKWKAEQIIRNNLSEYFIIRTSWMFGKGRNFVQSMLQLGANKHKISVVSDQKGNPTYAKDLAGFILHLIHKHITHYGVYNFSNTGSTSWYGFAKEIFTLAKSNIQLEKITSDAYPYSAKRPKNSTLDLTKTKTIIKYNIRCWQEALKEYMSNLETQMQ